MAARKRAARAVRLPSGKYAWRGRAVSFSRLPKAQRAQLRSGWAKKAARTARRKRAEIVVTRQEFGRTGMAFAADRDPKQQTLRQVMREVMKGAAQDMPGANRGAWIATVEWPDDDRSEPGEPYRTHVSRPHRAFDEGYSAEEEFAEMEALLDEVEETGGAFLDRNKSGAQGKAVITSVEFAVWYGV